MRELDRQRPVVRARTNGDLGAVEAPEVAADGAGQGQNGQSWLSPCSSSGIRLNDRSESPPKTDRF